MTDMTESKFNEIVTASNAIGQAVVQVFPAIVNDDLMATHMAAVGSDTLTNMQGLALAVSHASYFLKGLDDSTPEEMFEALINSDDETILAQLDKVLSVVDDAGGSVMVQRVREVRGSGDIVGTCTAGISLCIAALCYGLAYNGGFDGSVSVDETVSRMIDSLVMYISLFAMAEVDPEAAEKIFDSLGQDLH